MDVTAEDLPSNDPDILLNLVSVSIPLCIHYTVLNFLLKYFVVGLIHRKLSHKMLLRMNKLSAAQCGHMQLVVVVGTLTNQKGSLRLILLILERFDPNQSCNVC